MGIILRPTIHDERAEEEGATYHGIVRYTHYLCGYTTRIRGEMELLNDLDPACPRCSERRDDGLTVGYPYGGMVWENADGTIVETLVDANGSLVAHRRVFTHVTIYKSYVNGPEWWVVPQPGTGDLDDEFIVGFNHFWQARAALPGIRQIFKEMAPPDGLAWRDRRNPIYQLTPQVHVVHYVSQDSPDGPWSVWQETYHSSSDVEPLPSLTRHVSRHTTEAEAYAQADRLQKGS